MKHLQLSQLVAGLVVEHDLSAHEVPLDDLAPPYGKMVDAYREDDAPSLLDVVSFSAIEKARTMRKRVDGEFSPQEWVEILRRSASRERIKNYLESQIHRLDEGEDLDEGELMQVLYKNKQDNTEFITLDKVEPEEAVWVPSHYKPMDYWVGGYVKSNLTIIGGPPGVGKTGLLLTSAGGGAKNGKRSVLFSLEMTNAQLVLRLLEIMQDKGQITKEDRSMIAASDKAMDITQIYASGVRAAIKYKPWMIGIDFADRAIKGEVGPKTMEAVYNQCADLAKVTGIPVVLLAQLSDKHVGQVPKVNHLRWSRMAEAVAGLIYLIHNPGTIYTDKIVDPELPPAPGKGYLVIGKSRFGIKDNKGIGAIQVPWGGATAWGEEPSDWWPL